MHKVLVRFKIIKNDEIIDVYLDDRLNLIDNLSIISSLIKIDMKNVKVYDPHKGIFLNRHLPIREFNINSYLLLYLF